MKHRTAALSIIEGWRGAVWVSVISLGGYLFTLCPTVSFTDSGELAAAAANLGIAHPTGYPLFTLLGRCAVLVPVGVEEILKLNFLAALLTAGAVGVFYLVLMRLSQLLSPIDSRSSQKEQYDSFLKTVIRMAAALVLAFSTTVWSQSVAIEVYALHLLLILLCLYFFLSGWKDCLSEGEQVSGSWFAFSFFLGLSFSNHMSTSMLVPACLIMWVLLFGWRKQTILIGVRMLPFFLLGLSPYLYLPIRSQAHPVNDWGHPATLERLFWHISGKQYSSWMFSGVENAGKQLQHFFTQLPVEFNVIILLLVLPGSIFCYQNNRRLFSFLLLLIVSCLAIGINYGIHDIDSYFLLAFVVVGSFAYLGVSSISARFTTRSRAIPVLTALMVLLPGSQLILNKSGVDESQNFLLEDYTKSSLLNVEPNAVIFSYQWDYFVGPSIYFQAVQHLRKDVAVIDKELLRRSWYYIELERNQPWLIERSREKIERFLKELYKFEHGMPYHSTIIEESYVEMINDMIDRTIADRPVYVGPEIEPQFSAQYQRIPSGNLFRLTSPGIQASFGVSPAQITFRETSYSSYLAVSLRQVWSRMMALNASYHQSSGNGGAATEYRLKADQIRPKRPQTRILANEEN